jgi:hypothetical protein
MFEKCIECPRIGESCVPNLWLLPFPELFKWCVKRQKYLNWSNQDWADDSKVPVGTINRLKAGDTDCKYSTMRSLAISVIGGTRNEFACTEQVEKELRNLEQFEQQAAKMASVEKENEELRQRLEECREMNIFLKKENDRKAKIIDKYLD